MFLKKYCEFGFLKLKTEQLEIVEMFWQVFSLDICLDKSKSMHGYKPMHVLVFL
jgi:hypothetical protein